MDSAVSRRYQLFKSEKLKATLQSDHCKTVSTSVLKHINLVFKTLVADLPQAQQDITRLDPRYVMAAIHSACLDLHHANGFHELKDGPSPEKIGASVATWVNRLRPIQFAKAPDGDFCLFLNAILALNTGWSLMIATRHPSEEAAGRAKGPESVNLQLAMGHIQELLKENERGNDLVYYLMWRNPDFRQLTTLFQFIR